MTRSVTISTPRLKSEEIADFYGVSKKDYRFIVSLFKSEKTPRSASRQRRSNTASGKARSRASQAA